MRVIGNRIGRRRRVWLAAGVLIAAVSLPIRPSDQVVVVSPTPTTRVAQAAREPASLRPAASPASSMESSPAAAPAAPP